MPVTARLSKHFYDRLGEQVANELVEWFNQVDAQYRSDLRELNEHDFARFDAKVERRYSEQDARIERRLAAIEGSIALLREEIARRFAEQDARIAQQFVAQTRFLYVSLVAQLALIAGLYLR